MLQRDMNRTVGTLAAVFAAASGLFVLAVREREPRTRRVAPAAELYARHCATCHDEQDLRTQLDEAPDRALAWLERLEHHGSASSPEDLALVKWLAERR